MVLGTSPVVWAVAGLGGAILVVRTRRWRLAAAAGLALVLADVAANLLKRAVVRPRPPFDLALVHLRGWSMPSTQAALTAAVAVAVFLAEDWPANLRRWAGLFLAALVVAVGLAMIYLGGHWPTDVAAGWALGAALGFASLLIARAALAHR